MVELVLFETFFKETMLVAKIAIATSRIYTSSTLIPTLENGFHHPEYLLTPAATHY